MQKKRRGWPLFALCTFALVSSMSTRVLGKLSRSSTVLAFTNSISSHFHQNWKIRQSLLASTSYRPMSSSNTSSPSPVKDGFQDKLKFGSFFISRDHVFYTSQLSAAFVNLRPIVPGHILVMPMRVVPLLCDLTEEEYLDLWQSVRVVQNVLKKHFSSCDAFNIAVQDGKGAGQSVPHVHVHVLPRYVEKRSILIWC